MPIQSDGNAPYAPPKPFLDVLSGYRERGLQTPFTTDVLKKAGVTDALAPRTLQALRLLDLIDQDGEPTAELVELRKAPHDEFGVRLEAVVRSAYAEVFSYIDPAQDSTERVRDAFRHYNPPGMQERMVTLFLGLCEAAGIISARPKRTNVNGGRSRAPKRQTPTSPRSKTEAAASRSSVVDEWVSAPPSHQQAPGGHPIIQGLLRELPPINSKWPRAKYEAWLNLQQAAFNLLYEIEDKDCDHAPGPNR